LVSPLFFTRNQVQTLTLRLAVPVATPVQQQERQAAVLEPRAVELPEVVLVVVQVLQAQVLLVLVPLALVALVLLVLLVLVLLVLVLLVLLVLRQLQVLPRLEQSRGSLLQQQ
jgi:hypothetical protein